jgi:hypothetical protein
MKGLYNNQSRKSGGDKRPVINVSSVIRRDKPVLSIQCFENRCKDCDGIAKLVFPIPEYKCECKCHLNQESKE